MADLVATVVVFFPTGEVCFGSILFPSVHVDVKCTRRMLNEGRGGRWGGRRAMCVVQISMIWMRL